MTGRRGTGRLPSFKGKRDLTLGAAAPKAGASGKKAATPNLVSRASSSASAAAAAGGAEKKKFVPNLNIQRRKPAEADKAGGGGGAAAAAPRGSGWGAAAAASSSTSGASAAAAAGTDKKFGNRPKQELIQTMDAVFGDGISADGIRRKGGRGGGGGDGDGSKTLERPKLDLNFKIDKEAEAARLKALLRDDFIDDLSTGPLVPVQLPMVDTGTLFQKEEENEDEEKFKKKNNRRILDSDDDDDDDVTAKANDVKTNIKEEKVVPKKKGGSSSSDYQLTFTDLVKGQKGDLFFVQLPDHLPGHGRRKQQPEEGPSSADKPETEVEDLVSKCVLNDLPEGRLGTIRIRKSGKTQLVLGGSGTHMNLDLGTQVGFLQDVVSVEVPPPVAEGAEQAPPPPPPHMTVIGHLKHRLVMAPDWTKLFSSEMNSAERETSSSSDEEDEQDPNVH